MPGHSDFILYEISKLEELIQKGVADNEIIEKVENAKLDDKEKLLISKAKLDSMLEKSLNLDLPISTTKNEEIDVVKCPKCKSTQITADKTGYSLGKGLAGAFLTGGIGLIAGFHGSNNLQVHCIKCGHKWKAGKQ